MKLKLFNLPTQSPDQQVEALNQFCSSHRITSIERYFVDQGMNSFWSVAVTWVDGEGSLEPKTTKRAKVDYREVLNDEDFAVFSQLRELRKKLAKQEDTAVYNVFNNEQMAQMVLQNIQTKAALLKLEGVGQARVDKYGDAFLTELKTLMTKA